MAGRFPKQVRGDRQALTVAEAGVVECGECALNRRDRSSGDADHPAYRLPVEGVGQQRACDVEPNVGREHRAAASDCRLAGRDVGVDDHRPPDEPQVAAEVQPCPPLGVEDVSGRGTEPLGNEHMPGQVVRHIGQCGDLSRGGVGPVRGLQFDDWAGRVADDQVGRVVARRPRPLGLNAQGLEGFGQSDSRF